MADWSSPVLTSTYVSVLDSLKNRDIDAAVQFSPSFSTPTNLPTGTIRWNPTNGYWEIRSAGGTWSALITKYMIDVDKLDGQDGSYYLAWANLTGVPTTFTPSAHTHDDRYYTETESDARYANKLVASGNTIKLQTAGNVDLATLTVPYATDAGTVNGFSVGQSLTPTSSATFASLFSASLTSSSALALAATGANAITFSTNGVSRVTLSSGGNLGVGTATPGALLDVNGLTMIRGSLLLPGVTTEARIIDVGTGRTGDGYSALDLVGDTTYSDFGARFFRSGGANANSGLLHRGTGTLQLSADSGSISLRTSNVDRLFVLANGNVGVGTTTPSTILDVVGTGTLTRARLTDTTPVALTSTTHAFQIGLDTAANLAMDTNEIQARSNNTVASLALNPLGGTITLGSTASSIVANGDLTANLNAYVTGRVGIGTTNPGRKLVIVDTVTSPLISMVGSTTGSPGILFGDTVADNVGQIRYDNATDSMDFYTSATRQVRLTSDGIFLVGTTDTTPASGNSLSSAGCRLSKGGFAVADIDAAAAFFNRMGTDGVVVVIRGQGVTEGSIAVDGTTVSFNGGHLSRWSRLPEGDDSVLLKGTVMSNLNEMITWDGEQNEQLNMTCVSNEIGDPNVAGVFVGYDTEDNNGDFYMAMTGDMIIRIAAGQTVMRGDLLISAGDGTAMAQTDDIIRSNTIAKVTSTAVSRVYDDGSYCVPCVLMAT